MDKINGLTPIVSSSNNLVKKIKKLADRKFRTEYGEYIAEGRRWVSDAKRLCPQYVSAVICSESGYCEGADCVLSDKLFDELSQTENNQGIMAVMKIPEISAEFSSDYCLYLDRVRDPGNMGTILRTAVAAGFTDIVLNNCVDIYNPKVIRSSMTGILSVNPHYDVTLSDIKAQGYTVVAATLDGLNIFDSEPADEKTCLVIGNEAEGIDVNLLPECDRRVTIPMCANVESLNAAVSAGILMYELKYRNKKER